MPCGPVVRIPLWAFLLIKGDGTSDERRGRAQDWVAASFSLLADTLSDRLRRHWPLPWMQQRLGIFFVVIFTQNAPEGNILFEFAKSARMPACRLVAGVITHLAPSCCARSVCPLRPIGAESSTRRAVRISLGLGIVSTSSC